MVNRSATWQADPAMLRWLAWALILGVAIEAVVVSLVALWPPDRLRSIVTGQAHGWDGQAVSASLLYRDGRWVGSVGDFPPGSTTHFEPREHPGFYLVRFPDGTFLAMADRSPHLKAGRVEWRNPRPGSHNTSNPGPKAGFTDGDTVFFVDGFQETGPAPRPLDAFPLTVENERLSIAPYAHCPFYARGARWCDSRLAWEDPPDRCTKLSPIRCWSIRGGHPIAGRIYRLP
jgi:hypothetical protein